MLVQALDLFSTAIGAGVVQTRANSTLVGYKSTINNADINSTGAVAYNFYASGDAPNYFKGLTEHVGGVKLPALLSAPVLATDADGNIITSDALTESEGDGLYLSKVNDDTAAGKITFNERPTFEKGIEVIEGGSGTKTVYGQFLATTWGPRQKILRAVLFKLLFITTLTLDLQSIKIRLPILPLLVLNMDVLLILTLTTLLSLVVTQIFLVRLLVFHHDFSLMTTPS